MFARLVNSAALKPAAGLHARVAQQARFLATVEGSVGRVMPGSPRPRATPVSHDRATFTIRVRVTRIAEKDFGLTFLL
jgi:carbamoyl-phosphate synthase small subunit